MDEILKKREEILKKISEDYSLPKTNVDIPMPEIKPPTGGTGVSCNHKWIHLDNNKHIRLNEANLQYEQFLVDRFYCENCCKIKEITKYL